jgi:hypothetical protein
LQIAGSRPELIRRARISDLLPPDMIDFGRARRLDATAFLLSGASALDGYPARLGSSRDDFAAWDGRVVVMAADGAADHRVLIVNRYGQVYEAIDVRDASSQPGVAALGEWFKFLATACPGDGAVPDTGGPGSG